MKIKRFIAAVSAAVMMGGCLAGNVSATNSLTSEEGNTEGLSVTSDEEFDEYFGEPETIILPRSVLPSSVDLSQSPCFPSIGDQGGVGACASFATTYYQFSYEVNKLNNVTSTEDRVIYSPKWTYNLTNNGSNNGSSIDQTYDVLKNFGGLKNSDFPFTNTGNVSDYMEIPENLIEQKREALNIRITNDSYVEIPETYTITNVNDSKVNELKTLINNGKVLTTTTRNRWNTVTVNGECVAIRCYEGGAHALTIVGYNDNIYYDVNGNGTIENCEKGAFKVANSWGTHYTASQGYGSFTNDGFFWVMYDALNKTSANTVNNWENSYSGTRSPAFEFEYSTKSTFHYIDVAKKDVNLIGELSINTSNREGLILKINRTNSNVTNWTSTGSKILYPFSGVGTSGIAFNGILLFDYDSYANPVSSYITGYNWHVCLGGTEASETQATFRIADNKGNLVTNYKNLSGNTLSAYHNISLQKGDVDYDGEVTADDSNIVMNYVAMITKLSNLQYYLADYNNDGTVSVTDVVAINMSLSSSASLSELAKINAVNARVQEYCMKNNLGVDCYEN